MDKKERKNYIKMLHIFVYTNFFRNREKFPKSKSVRLRSFYVHFTFILHSHYVQVYVKFT